MDTRPGDSPSTPLPGREGPARSGAATREPPAVARTGPPRPPATPRPTAAEAAGERDAGRAEASLLLLQELAAARQRADALQRELDAVRAQRLGDARELGELKRQRDGLQFRTDYLEEKLDQLRRATAPKRRWFGRATRQTAAPDMRRPARD